MMSMISMRFISYNSKNISKTDRVESNNIDIIV